MPIQILWGNDLNAQNTFIQKLIDKEVSTEWREINVTNLNGDDDEQVNKAFDEILTPPFGEGCRIVTLKNNPIFTKKNEDLRTKFEKIHDNIPKNTYFVLQNTKKPDTRLKSTKFLHQLIKNKLAKEKSFSLICGHFEGVDERVLSTRNIVEISIGDFILSGGETAALVVLDSVLRLLPGVLGNEKSVTEETFENGLLEYPQYTKPQIWEEKSVPDVLLSGDHSKIKDWRLSQSEAITRVRRPDLWEKYKKN